MINMSERDRAMVKKRVTIWVLMLSTSHSRENPCLGCKLCFSQLWEWCCNERSRHDERDFEFARNLTFQFKMGFEGEMGK